MSIRYEQDFYGWTLEQVNLLRSGRLDEVDLEHLIEEIESVGNSERHELESRLEVLLQHLLKWQFQPSRRGSSWRLTIQEQRKRIIIRLRKSPSLKSSLDEIMTDAYDVAKTMAERETGLSENMFSEQCPWTFEEVMNAEFLPD
ncbi:DUF29 domain-containing protein [Chitinilyticum aquatile]|uniref:DUF29 domain-containing protein n=1 Tax=Chitinilyticum aquatile TaxID=362520 RepID=UPI00048BBDEA|nr:DUF29 domain-containing protein [Chitinilyticum aquatile]